MTEPDLAHLADVAELLRSAGYELACRELAGAEALLGETPYALVACVELEGWETLDERVFDVQAALTRVSGEAPSARTWDLYLVVLVRSPARDAGDRALVEEIEGDTRYARKFVLVATPRGALDRAMRPLLPLRPPTGLEIRDPLGELRDELRALDIADQVADVALDAFERTDTVEVP
jgi:hypothetical protein